MSWLDFWREMDAKLAARESATPPSYSGGDECPESGETISRDRARTIQSELRIQRGFHPFGFRLREPRGETCGTCEHLRDIESNSRRVFYKCALRGDSRGPATDCRKKWPACERWAAMKAVGK